MLTERIWSGNSLRNFHYLIADPDSGEALAVDPLDWRLVLDTAKQRGWKITQILNTHEHSDHTGGNVGLKDATGAKVLAHEGAAPRIGTGIDRGLKKGDLIKVGARRARVPGHPGAHHDARVRAVAHRHAGAVLRRHALQRRRRQLLQRRQPGGAVRHLRDAARAPAGLRRGCTPGTSTWRATWSSPSTASPPTGRRRVPRRGQDAPARRRAGDDARRGEAHQHLPAPAEPGR